MAANICVPFSARLDRHDTFASPGIISLFVFFATLDIVVIWVAR
jgi:hypothetical protein